MFGLYCTRVRHRKTCGVHEHWYSNGLHHRERLGHHFEIPANPQVSRLPLENSLSHMSVARDIENQRLAVTRLCLKIEIRRKRELLLGIL